MWGLESIIDTLGKYQAIKDKIKKGMLLGRPWEDPAVVLRLWWGAGPPTWEHCMGGCRWLPRASSNPRAALVLIVLTDTHAPHSGPWN